MNSKAIAIMDAGQRLFFERGIQDTSMEQIAEAVPVAKMTIYKYFQSKEGLLEAITDRMAHESHQYLLRVMEEAGNIHELFDLLLKYQPFDRISLTFINDLTQYYPNLFAKMMAYQEAHVIPEFEAAIFRGQQRGDIRKELSPHLVVRYIVSMKQFFLQPGNLDKRMNVRTLSDQITTMLCYGIMSDRPSDRE
ncbi:TetR/AcrR family transcriptional regulator [Paenibacillus alvei]|uniref:TetR/AcrR family transcriptional regulator n=1 Tax=Paenibacillus alvei TaxID=44250 RepID=UPI0022803006|nr:TetR/AcrR family transcriptional regulator [Paenibacillus alvei]MCY7483788.1 TetR/AcrR family transcriptional regulator [Paenibacillus alvei]